MTRIGIYLDASSEQYAAKSQYNTVLNGTLYTHYICDLIVMAVFVRHTATWKHCVIPQEVE